MRTNTQKIEDQVRYIRVRVEKKNVRNVCMKVRKAVFHSFKENLLALISSGRSINSLELMINA